MQFSEDLKERLKEYIRKKGGPDISDDEADEYLERLGRFGLLATEILSPDHGSSQRARRDGSVAPIAGGAGESQERGGTEPLSEYPQPPVDGDNQ